LGLLAARDYFWIERHRPSLFAEAWLASDRSSEVLFVQWTGHVCWKAGGTLMAKSAGGKVTAEGGYRKAHGRTSLGAFRGFKRPSTSGFLSVSDRPLPNANPTICTRKELPIFSAIC
jgi:hypothetical protein